MLSCRRTVRKGPHCHRRIARNGAALSSRRKGWGRGTGPNKERGRAILSEDSKGRARAILREDSAAPFHAILEGSKERGLAILSEDSKDGPAPSRWRGRAILSDNSTGRGRGIPSADSKGRGRAILSEDSKGPAQAILSEDSAEYVPTVSIIKSSKIIKKRN